MTHEISAVPLERRVYCLLNEMEALASNLAGL